MARKKRGGAEPPLAAPEKRPRYKAFAQWPELLPPPDAVFAAHGSDPADVATQATRRQIEDWRVLFKREKNPLYAWLAIAYSFAHKAPLPEWCLEYIKACSFEIYVLMQLVCGRDFLINLTAENGTMDPKSAHKHLAAALQITNDGGGAFVQLQRGRQAMRDAAEDYAAGELKKHSPAFLGQWERYKDEPKRARQAIRARRDIGEKEDGTGDDRQLRRQIARGRELIHPLAPKPPKRTKPRT